MRFAFVLLAACAACNAIDGADQYKKAGDSAPPGCSQSCLSAAQGCLSACTNTHTSCLSSCGPPSSQQCKQCDNDFNACTGTCTNTCTSCGQDCTLALCTSDAGTD